MLNYDIEQNNIEKSEFLSKAEIQGLTTYSKEQVQEYANMYKSLMSKAEMQELSKEETVQMKIFKSELESLKKVTVIDEKLQKSDMYYRSKDDISKSEAIESDFKALSLQNECEVLIKSFEANIITEETLEKAIGGKYYKREPKPGGGYKYYYTEAQYKKEKGGDKFSDNTEKLKERASKMTKDEAATVWAKVRGKGDKMNDLDKKWAGILKERLTSKGESKQEGKSKKEEPAFNIPGAEESIANDYNSGKLTLRQAAEEFYETGKTNFVDLEYTKKKLAKYPKK